MTSTTTAAPDLPTFGDYVAVIRRRLTLILLVTATVVLVVAAYTAALPDEYTSSSTVLVRPITRDPLDAYDRPGQLIDLQTERQLVTSALVVDRARGVLGDAPLEELVERIEVIAPEDAQIMHIGYRAPAAREAADGANALADAYVAHRAERATSAIARSTEGLDRRLDELAAELEEVSRAVAASAAAPNSVAAIDAQNRRNLLQGQITLLSNELTQRLASGVDPGEVIAPAQVPEGRSSPRPARATAVALAAGLVLGLAAALIRDRLDDHLRDASAAGRILGARVLSVLPVGGGLGSREASTVNAYRRLALSLDDRRPDALLVASFEPLLERTLTAVNLAVTLAEEHRVLLVDVPRSHPAVQELLASNADAPSRALGDAPTDDRAILQLRHPSPVHVIPTEPAAPTASRYGQSKGSMTALLDAVHQDYDFVIVDAAPLSTSTDALELRDLSSGVVFAVRVGTTLLSDLSEAAAMLEQVGLRTLGVVVHTRRRLRPGRRRPAPSPSRARTTGRSGGRPEPSAARHRGDAGGAVIGEEGVEGGELVAGELP